jgi:hypothetical protein
MEILIESMTRLVIMPAPGRQFIIRLWRQEEKYSDAIRQRTLLQAAALAEGFTYPINGKLTELPDKCEVAKVLLGMERMNAVEVLDESGEGVVVYKDWP